METVTPMLLLGAYNYEVTGVTAGAAFLYAGNGLERSQADPAQLHYWPVPYLRPTRQFGCGTAIRLMINASSPTGRSKLRMRWEVLSLPGSPESPHLGTGPWRDTGTPILTGSSIAIDQTIPALTPASPFRWRVRLESRSPIAPRSPWYSPVFNSPTESDFRTSGLITLVEGPVQGTAPAIKVTAISPNPFQSIATVGYTLAAPGRVRVTVFDVHGRVVARLNEGFQIGRPPFTFPGTEPVSMGSACCRNLFS